MTIHISTSRPTIFNAQYLFEGIWQMKASQEEKDAANASTNLSNAITSNMNTTFANSQAIQGGLNSRLNMVLNQGLANKGFMNGEEANLRSDADENAAQSNVQAEQALSARTAGQSQGGASTSGAVGAEDAMLASDAAQKNAAAQRGITTENAALARDNVTTGLNGLSNLSGQETNQTDALSGTAVNGSGQSFNEETQAYQPSNFWSNLGGDVIGMGLNAVAPGLNTLAGGLFKKNSSTNNNPDGYDD